MTRPTGGKEGDHPQFLAGWFFCALGVWEDLMGGKFRVWTAFEPSPYGENSRVHRGMRETEHCARGACARPWATVQKPNNTKGRDNCLTLCEFGDLACGRVW